MPLQAFLRIAAIASPITLVAMSWLPLAAAVRIGLPQSLEHVLAFFGSSVLIKAGWPRVSSVKLLPPLAALAALLEVGQLWMPGRSAQLADFAFGMLGIVLALAIELAFDSLRDMSTPSGTVLRSGSTRSARVTEVLGKTGLLSLLAAGAVLTIAWIAGLLWALYLVSRWLLG